MSQKLNIERESGVHDILNRNIAIAFFLNLGFTLVEFVGAFWTNSIAIQSDALHDAGDTLALGLAWYLQGLSRKGRSNTFTFGYKRFNILGALITGTILATGSVVILSEAIPRLFAPEEVEVEGMIGIAVLGVVVNTLAVWRMKKAGTSLNETMITWHLIEDVLGWVVVLLGSVLMYFFHIPWMDAALSILITLYILFNVLKNLLRGFKIMLEAVPEHLEVNKLKSAMEKIPEVKEAHDIHVWTLDGEYSLLSAHIQADPEIRLEEIGRIRGELERSLKEEFKLDHITLQFEIYPDDQAPEDI